jgi:signal transduction histidine kinase
VTLRTPSDIKEVVQTRLEGKVARAIPPAFTFIGLGIIVAGLVSGQGLLVAQGSLPIFLSLWVVAQLRWWPSHGMTPIVGATSVAMWVGVLINPLPYIVILGVVGLAAIGYAWLFLTKVPTSIFTLSYALAYGTGVATWSWGSTRLTHLLVGVAVAVLWLVPVPMLTLGFRSLAEMVSLKNRMVSTVSHEFRGPLSVISGILNSGDDNDVVESVDLLRDAAKTLEIMTEDLLVALLPEGSEVTVNVTALDASALVASVAPEEFTIEGLDEVVILGDQLRVRQVLRNLISNTSRYGGPLRAIEIRRMNGYGLIAVRDNGDGVPGELEETLFTAFAASGEVSGSVGIGLAVSFELAQRMGGELTYAREAGETVFSLSLPLG